MYKRNKLKSALGVFALAMVIGTLNPITANAAGEGNVNILKDNVRLNVGETTVITVDYSNIPGGYGDLGVVSADGTIAATMMVDVGNNQAHLAIGGLNMGTTAIAVYRVSNPAVVDYVAVQCGLAAKGQIINQVNGSSLTTIYDDRIINYNSILTGKNNAQLAVTSLVLEREKGIDCLKVSGELLAKDSKMPGMTTFYANYYDAMGGLMKRQAIYTRDPLANTHMEIKWYIPDGCTHIVIE